MNKILSILTVFPVLAGMLNFSVSWHCCGGKLAAAKVSLSGTLVTCGIKDTESNCPFYHNGDLIESHCV